MFNSALFHRAVSIRSQKESRIRNFPNICSSQHKLRRRMWSYDMPPPITPHRVRAGNELCKCMKADTRRDATRAQAKTAHSPGGLIPRHAPVGRQLHGAPGKRRHQGGGGTRDGGTRKEEAPGWLSLICGPRSLTLCLLSVYSLLISQLPMPSHLAPFKNPPSPSLWAGTFASQAWTGLPLKPGLYSTVLLPLSSWSQSG